MTSSRRQRRGTTCAAAVRLAPTLGCVALLFAAAACTPPSARPTPQPPTPAPTRSPSGGGAAARPPAAATPTTPSSAAAGAAVRAGAPFSYAAGNYRYVVTSEATVELSSDSGGQQRRSESVASRLVVGYRVGGRGEGARPVTGAVDSFTVSRSGAPAIASPLSAPLVFRGTIDATHTRLELHPGTSAASPRIPAGGDCNSPSEALLVLAREALAVVPPGALTPGRTWDDSTESRVCRGDVPLTVRSIHHYRAEGVERRGEVDAVHLIRTSDVGVTGQGSQRGLTVTVSGRGSARADLYVDVVGGRFLGGEGESTLELELRAPEKATQRVVQRSRVKVEEQL